MGTRRKSYNFLLEQTSVASSRDIEILHEAKVEGGLAPKLVFKAHLQESNNVNGNRRIYPDAVCRAIVEQLEPKSKSRSLLMEVDHPLVSGEGDVSKKRATIVELKNCGALIREIQYHNGKVVGILETLSGFRGPDVANLISRDKVDIGFSLRALGSVTPLQNGLVEVTLPVKAITYDIVSNPSHKDAKILEFLPEHCDEYIPDSSSVIYENDDSLLRVDNIHLLENDPIVESFIEEIVNEEFLSIISKNIKFKIGGN